MNILVFDTETTGLEKPYCYNVGYVVVNADNGERLVRRSFVVEQIWHNLALFNTAYYADKRPIYVADMRAKKTTMDKWGYIMGQMRRDIKTYEISDAYAYNSSFDDKVFSFNCEWFHTLNPLDEIAVHDIWATAQHFLVDDNYKQFCEEHELFTETGNYKTSAESMFQYWFKEDFTEEHTALADSEIEATLLLKAVSKGADLKTDYTLLRSIKREMVRPFKVMVNGEVVLETEYTEMWKKKDLSLIKLKTK